MDIPKLNAQDFIDMASASLAKNARLRDQPTGERSAERAAAILSAWTGMTWAEADVWRCLLAVKLAREIQGDFHADDYVDIAGFAALLGEQQSRQNRNVLKKTHSAEVKTWSAGVRPRDDFKLPKEPALINPYDIEGMV